MDFNEWIKLMCDETVGDDARELAAMAWRQAGIEQRKLCAEAVGDCETTEIKNRIRRDEAIGACLLAKEHPEKDPECPRS